MTVVRSELLIDYFTLTVCLMLLHIKKGYKAVAVAVLNKGAPHHGQVPQFFCHSQGVCAANLWLLCGGSH